MTKIDKEEYETLKGLDDKWKWIARDEDRGLYAFTKKPVRKDGPSSFWWDAGGWDAEPYSTLDLFDEIHLFQFIKWEDEEPHNISELIEEYEHKEFYDYVGWKYAEREETEVEKDIEWLKREINELPIMFIGFSILKQREEFGINKDDVMELIDQLDETEVKQLYGKIEELESYNDELIRDNNQFRNELDNQDVLSEEWIDEHSNGPSRSQYVWVDDLKEILVSKQEVTIDKEDAENIAHYKKMGWTLSHLINDYGEDVRHDELLAKAWLVYPNIVVEEEQKYIVSDNSSIPLLIKNDSGEIMSYDSQIAYNNSNGTIELTEQEIKSYDERYMTFAKPVEEIEK